MKFEKTIHINEVNPKSATVVEMRALEVHMEGKEAGRLAGVLGFMNKK